ncbi:unnamed protein product [Linum tenue]|uniref:Uncharacterized protein n=1 Tax=Linum tenue TaxID=586396 RepID=A0AAV0IZI1_9ROSI|nr:unnamed protein product [Linum tenue]
MHSFSVVGNSLHHLDQGGYTLPPLTLAGAGGYAFGDHVQNPCNQESLFSSLSVSSIDKDRRLNGFTRDDNQDGGGAGVGV